MKWIKKYWWVILVCTTVLYLIAVGIINNPNLNQITKDVLSYFNTFIPSLGVVLGLFLGYPLLKKKLVEDSISKRFEIMIEANRLVGKECLKLREKYPIRDGDTLLTHEYLNYMIKDIRILFEKTIDANPYAYRYMSLVYHSLLRFHELTKEYIPNDRANRYTCETLSIFVNVHFNQIYSYSKSIGFIPSNNIIEKDLLVKRMNKYVTNNILYMISGSDIVNLYDNASALLVLFFYNYNSSLLSRKNLLLKCCYESAPSPCPFARIMYNENIYIPLVIYDGKEKNSFELNLVGFERIKETKSDGETHLYRCHYANIQNFIFVSTLIKEKENISQYNDSYIVNFNSNFNLADDIKNFQVNGEQFSIDIDERRVKEYFVKVKNSLRGKMNEEINNNRL